MSQRFASAVLLIVALAAAPAWAQAPTSPANDMQALRNAVKADKRGLVASTLELTPQEAAKFWPIYDKYQRALNAANRQITLAVEDIVARDRPMSDQFAKQLTKEMMEADQAELKARQTMQKGVLKALPPKKAARYLQLESKIRAFQDYDVAAGIPLIK
jgi:Spy/CpxP family protein refolding chaperone